MSKENDKAGYKKFLMFLVGVFVLILGVTFVLVWWEDVAAVFRGFIGVILAIAGLVVLYMTGK